MSEHQTPPEEELIVASEDTADTAPEPDVTAAPPQEAAELAAQLALVTAERDRLKAELDEQNSSYLRLAADLITSAPIDKGTRRARAAKQAGHHH
nr:hypothetical protein [Synechococcus elongatus]